MMKTEDQAAVIEATITTKTEAAVEPGEMERIIVIEAAEGEMPDEAAVELIEAEGEGKDLTGRSMMSVQGVGSIERQGASPTTMTTYPTAKAIMRHSLH